MGAPQEANTYKQVDDGQTQEQILSTSPLLIFQQYTLHSDILSEMRMKFPTLFENESVNCSLQFTGMLSSP